MMRMILWATGSAAGGFTSGRESPTFMNSRRHMPDLLPYGAGDRHNPQTRHPLPSLFPEVPATCSSIEPCIPVRPGYKDLLVRGR